MIGLEQEIPSQIRDFAEKSVERAREAFLGFTARRAEGYERNGVVLIRRQGRDDEGHVFCEDNVKAALDLAQKLVRAKDVQESSGVADRVREVASRGDGDAGEGARRHGAGGRHRGNQELETD